jgi:predicted lipoprotein with Yx(FWY)xxD motif
MTLTHETQEGGSMKTSPAGAALARPSLFLAVLALAATAAVVVVAHARAAATHPATTATVALRKTTLGMILVDVRGRTLYLFKADKGAKSLCYGQCAAAWPPLLTTAAPRAGAGVKTALLRTAKRRDGKLQVVYAGHPLYFFVADKKAGQTNGENVDHFGGEWYAVSAAGKQVEKPAAAGGGTTTTPAAPTTTSSTTTSSTGGGGGYGSGY